MSKKDIHVTRRDEGWAVVRENADRASKLFPTQSKAVKWGRELARGAKVELVTHDRKNHIRDSDSYGHDPTSSVDTRH